MFDGKGERESDDAGQRESWLKRARGKIDEQRRQREKNKGREVRKPQRLPQRGR